MWTKNFKLFFIGTILSALGGIGLNVAFGVIIFSETQSTFLSAIFTAITMIPNFVLPILIGPYVDRQNPLKVLVRNEVFLGLVFLIASIVTYFNEFSYPLYLIIVVTISSLGVFSELSYSNILPHIMERRDYVRGNAIIGTIYPMASIVVTPLAMLLFKQYGISLIFLVYSFLTFGDAFLESKIDMEFELQEAPKENILQTYAQDLKDAYHYIKSNRDLSTILKGVGMMMFVGGTFPLLYPHFNLSPHLSDTDYALLMSMSSVGYAAGGLFHYFVKIPSHRRYQIAMSVYFIFAIVDGFMLFYPLVGMFAAKILLGMLGMNSANIRMSAVQQKVDNRYRAKVNAL
ncbi:MAG: MFS transporter, partial [Gallicola sp.]|nr:MFS transporter [Gallicola sp.]